MLKLRLAVVGLILALCAVPAMADSVGLQNGGLMSGTLGGGVTLSSVLTGFNVNGTPLFTCPCGSIGFDTGSMTGGSFSGGTFQIALDGVGTILISNSFSGTITSLGGDDFKLVGTFSTLLNGVNVTGQTTQYFELENEGGQLSLEDVHGRTYINGPSAAVPEPGSLTLLGTGLVGLGGLVRRKLGMVK